MINSQFYFYLFPIIYLSYLHLCLICDILKMALISIFLPISIFLSLFSFFIFIYLYSKDNADLINFIISLIFN